MLKGNSLSLFLYIVSLLNAKKNNFRNILILIDSTIHTYRIVKRSYRQTAILFSMEFPSYFPVHRARQRLRNTCSTSPNRQQLVKELNKDILLNSVFLLVLQPLVQLSTIVKEMLTHKFIRKMQVEFSTLKDPRGIAEYILNELFETLFDNGIKNIKHFVQLRVTSIIQGEDPEGMMRPNDVRRLYTRLYESISGIDSADLIKPTDNRRLSEITLKHFASSKETLRRTSSTDMLFENSLFFNDFVDIMSQREGHSLNSIFVEGQPIRTESILNDAVFIWLGDILNCKIFSDADYIMRIIEKTDVHCKQEKYRPNLHRISEQIEEEETYRSDDDDSYGMCTPSFEQLNAQSELQENLTMLQCKITFQEYIKLMCDQAIDLIRSANYQVLFHYSLQEQFQYFQTIFERTLKDTDRKLWWYSINLIYKINDQISLSQDSHLLKIEEFSNAIRKTLSTYHNPRQRRHLSNIYKGIKRYSYTHQAMIEFVQLYFDIK